MTPGREILDGEVEMSPLFWKLSDQVEAISTIQRRPSSFRLTGLGPTMRFWMISMADGDDGVETKDVVVEQLCQIRSTSWRFQTAMWHL